MHELSMHYVTYVRVPDITESGTVTKGAFRYGNAPQEAVKELFAVRQYSGEIQEDFLFLVLNALLLVDAVRWFTTG